MIDDIQAQNASMMEKAGSMARLEADTSTPSTTTIATSKESTGEEAAEHGASIDL